MKLIIGIVLIALGIILGLYFGVWWAFIGGIIQIVQSIKAEEIQAASLAFGIAKVVFAAFIGWITAFCFMLPGFGFIAASK